MLPGLDSKHTPNEVQSWWKVSCQLCAKPIVKGASILMTIDGNLRVRQADEPWIGQVLDPPGNSGVSQKFIADLATLMMSWWNASMTQAPSLRAPMVQQRVLDAITFWQLRTSVLFLSQLGWITDFKGMRKGTITYHCELQRCFLHCCDIQSSNVGTRNILERLFRRIMRMEHLCVQIAVSRWTRKSERFRPSR